MRKCSICKENKEDSQFYLQKQRNGSNRLCSWCKDCSVKRSVFSNRVRRNKNPEESRKKEREYWHMKAKFIHLSKRSQWEKSQKIKYVEYKGGKCQLCGYSKCIAALDFHHINPKEKEFSITTYRKSWDIVRPELDKCNLLCANCHREIHHG